VLEKNEIEKEENECEGKEEQNKREIVNKREEKNKKKEKKSEKGEKQVPQLKSYHTLKLLPKKTRKGSLQDSWTFLSDCRLIFLFWMLWSICQVMQNS